MPAIYEHCCQVCRDDIDGQGHVNNLIYLKWMQEAAIAHSSAQGWPPERYQEIGAGWVVRSHAITYLQPAFLGERITVRTWVANFKKIQSLRKYRILRDDGTALAVAETNWAFVGREHHVPRRVPAELVEAFVVVTQQEEL